MSRSNKGNRNNFTGRQASEGEGIPDPAELARQRDEAAAAEAEKQAAVDEAVAAEAQATAAVQEGALGAPVADLPAENAGITISVQDGEFSDVNITAAVASLSDPIPEVQTTELKTLGTSTAVEASSRSVEIPAPPLAVPEVKTTLDPAPVLQDVKVEAETAPPTYQSRVAVHSAVKTARAATPESFISAFEPGADFSATVANELQRGTPTAVRLINFLNTYVVDMAPRRPRTPEQIRKAQEGLYLKLYELVETAPILEFDRLWRIAIMYFREYREQCFSPLYAMRGGQEWSRAPEQFHLFTRLMNILMACATDHARDVSIPADAQTGLSIEALGRLRNFIDAARLKELKTNKA